MQRRSLLVWAFVFLAACQRSEPEIGRGLPSEYAAATEAFDRRIKQRFPPGTNEKSLVRALEVQGFTVIKHGGWSEANFSKNYLLFETIWSVRWKESDSSVREIEGLLYGRGF